MQCGRGGRTIRHYTYLKFSVEKKWVIIATFVWSKVTICLKVFVKIGFTQWNLYPENFGHKLILIAQFWANAFSKELLITVALALHFLTLLKLNGQLSWNVFS